MDWRLRSQRRQVFNEAGQGHELTFSCFRRYKFLAAEKTCQWLADEIGQARIQLHFSLWAYVFMPEHVHLIIFPRKPDYDIRKILKAIKEPVGRKAVIYLRTHAPEWLPRVTVRRGKRTERRFWQTGGGYDRNITESHTLFAMIEYIHLNPVRRGLVLRACDWKWSSAGWFDGEGQNSLGPDNIDPGLL